MEYGKIARLIFKENLPDFFPGNLSAAISTVKAQDAAMDDAAPY